MGKFSIICFLHFSGEYGKSLVGKRSALKVSYRLVIELIDGSSKSSFIFLSIFLENTQTTK